jgi:16S rRNA processing protein RimM
VGEKHAQMTIARVRAHNDGLLLGFRGVGSPQEAGKYRNAVVSVKAADRPALPEGRYYHHQLIGLKVQTDTGEALGVLTEIMTTGANDVYVVTDEAGRELLLPAIESVILDIDLQAGLVKVHLIPGLLESQAGV